MPPPLESPAPEVVNRPNIFSAPAVAHTSGYANPDDRQLRGVFAAGFGVVAKPSPPPAARDGARPRIRGPVTAVVAAVAVLGAVSLVVLDRPPEPTPADSGGRVVDTMVKPRMRLKRPEVARPRGSRTERSARRGKPTRSARPKRRPRRRAPRRPAVPPPSVAPAPAPRQNRPPAPPTPSPAPRHPAPDAPAPDALPAPVPADSPPEFL